jgi:4-amino-4-deoxy-L-arabinose transferase-like glycosyltransferase
MVSMVDKSSNSRQIDTTSFFGRSPVSIWVTLALIFILGLGIRLYDLTDPPLDFHSTRQLWSAIIARGMYYQGLEDAPAWQTDIAVEAWKAKPTIEPTIFETIVALTYEIVGQEVIWIPRIYSSLFWLVGGLGLYTLAREMTTVDGGVIALIFYIFVPFGVIASRSFQPDPLMVMWIILAWWAFVRWHRSPSWKNAIMASLFAGIAMLIKSVAVFMLLGGMAALILTTLGIKMAIKSRQVWSIAIISTLPVLVYTIYGVITLGMENQFQGRFFPEMLKDPSHYVQWGSEMMSIVGFSGLILGMVGVYLFKNNAHKTFMLGLWGGYFVYGLFFPYHFLTHNYYHLPLIPLTAISLAPVAGSVFDRVSNLNLRRMSKSGIIGVILLGVVLQIWDARVELARNDYRHEPPYWETVAGKVERGSEVVALTQDYGDRLLYFGWLQVRNWPETGHLAYRDLRGGKTLEFNEMFDEYTLEMDYFLVTRIKELDRQSELKNKLFNNYAISEQGDGYIMFELNRPLP